MGSIFFACDAMLPLLGKIVPHHQISTISWNHFADGTDNIFIHDLPLVEGRKVFFFASFHTPREIFRQFSVMVVLLESFVESLTVVLPYYPTATMERVEVEGTVATANTLAWLFNSLPRASIATKVLVYDLHTLQNRFYLKGGAIARLDTAIPLLVDEVMKVYGAMDKEGLVFAFPDEGACKRFRKALPGSSAFAVCGKVRRGDERIVTLQDGDVSQATDIIIVDDLVQSGGTLLECGKVLKAAAAPGVKLSAFVTHAVFPGRSWKRFLAKNDSAGSSGRVFDRFWITDSRPFIVKEIMDDPGGKEMFSVLSLAPLIMKHIMH